MIEIVEPFRARRSKLTDGEVLEVLRGGASRAKTPAQQVIAEVREAIGLQIF